MKLRGFFFRLVVAFRVVLFLVVIVIRGLVVARLSIDTAVRILIARAIRDALLLRIDGIDVTVCFAK